MYLVLHLFQYLLNESSFIDSIPCLLSRLLNLMANSVALMATLNINYIISYLYKTKEIQMKDIFYLLAETAILLNIYEMLIDIK